MADKGHPRHIDLEEYDPAQFDINFSSSGSSASHVESVRTKPEHREDRKLVEQLNGIAVLMKRIDSQLKNKDKVLNSAVTTPAKTPFGKLLSGLKQKPTDSMMSDSKAYSPVPLRYEVDMGQGREPPSGSVFRNHNERALEDPSKNPNSSMEPPNRVLNVDDEIHKTPTQTSQRPKSAFEEDEVLPSWEKSKAAHATPPRKISEPKDKKNDSPFILEAEENLSKNPYESFEPFKAEQALNKEVPVKMDHSDISDRSRSRSGLSEHSFPNRRKIKPEIPIKPATEASNDLKIPDDIVVIPVLSYGKLKNLKAKVKEMGFSAHEKPVDNKSDIEMALSDNQKKTNVYSLVNLADNLLKDLEKTNHKRKSMVGTMREDIEFLKKNPESPEYAEKLFEIIQSLRKLEVEETDFANDKEHNRFLELSKRGSVQRIYREHEHNKPEDNPSLESFKHPKEVKDYVVGFLKDYKNLVDQIRTPTSVILSQEVADMLEFIEKIETSRPLPEYIDFLNLLSLEIVNVFKPRGEEEDIADSSPSFSMEANIKNKIRDEDNIIFDFNDLLRSFNKLGEVPFEELETMISNPEVLAQLKAYRSEMVDTGKIDVYSECEKDIVWLTSQCENKPRIIQFIKELGKDTLPPRTYCNKTNLDDSVEINIKFVDLDLKEETKEPAPQNAEKAEPDIAPEFFNFKREYEHSPSLSNIFEDRFTTFKEKKKEKISPMGSEQRINQGIKPNLVDSDGEETVFLSPNGKKKFDYKYALASQLEDLIDKIDFLKSNVDDLRKELKPHVKNDNLDHDEKISFLKEISQGLHRIIKIERTIESTKQPYTDLKIMIEQHVKDTEDDIEEHLKGLFKVWPRASKAHQRLQKSMLEALKYIQTSKYMNPSNYVNKLDYQNTLEKLGTIDSTLGEAFEQDSEIFFSLTEKLAKLEIREKDQKELDELIAILEKKRRSSKIKPLESVSSDTLANVDYRYDIADILEQLIKKIESYRDGISELKKEVISRIKVRRMGNDEKKVILYSAVDCLEVANEIISDVIEFTPEYSQLNDTVEDLVRKKGGDMEDYKKGLLRSWPRIIKSIQKLEKSDFDCLDQIDKSKHMRPVNNQQPALIEKINEEIDKYKKILYASSKESEWLDFTKESKLKQIDKREKLDEALKFLIDRIELEDLINSKANEQEIELVEVENASSEKKVQEDGDGKGDIDYKENLAEELKDIIEAINEENERVHELKKLLNDHNKKDDLSKEDKLNLLKEIKDSIKRVNDLERDIGSYKPEFDELEDTVDKRVLQTGEDKSAHKKGLLKTWPRAQKALQKLQNSNADCLEQLENSKHMNGDSVSPVTDKIKQEMTEIKDQLREAAQEEDPEAKTPREINQQVNYRQKLINRTESLMEELKEEEEPAEKKKDSPREQSALDYRYDLAEKVKDLMDKIQEINRDIHVVKDEVNEKSSQEKIDKETKLALLTDIVETLKDINHLEQEMASYKPAYNKLADSVQERVQENGEDPNDHDKGLIKVWPKVYKALHKVEGACSECLEKLEYSKYMQPDKNENPKDSEELKKEIQAVRENIENTISQEPICEEMIHTQKDQSKKIEVLEDHLRRLATEIGDSSRKSLSEELLSGKISPAKSPQSRRSRSPLVSKRSMTDINYRYDLAEELKDIIDNIEDSIRSIRSLKQEIKTRQKDEKLGKEIKYPIIQDMLDHVKNVVGYEKDIGAYKPAYDQIEDLVDKRIHQSGEERSSHNKGLLKTWPKAQKALQKLQDINAECLKDLNNSKYMHKNTPSEASENLNQKLEILESQLEMASKEEHTEAKTPRELAQSNKQLQKLTEKAEDLLEELKAEENVQLSSRPSSRRTRFPPPDYRYDLAEEVKTLMKPIEEAQAEIKRIQCEVAEKAEEPQLNKETKMALLQGLVEGLKDVNVLEKKMARFKPAYDRLEEQVEERVEKNGDDREDHQKGLLKVWPLIYKGLQKVEADCMESLEEVEACQYMKPENSDKPEEIERLNSELKQIKEQSREAASEPLPEKISCEEIERIYIERQIPLNNASAMVALMIDPTVQSSDVLSFNRPMFGSQHSSVEPFDYHEESAEKLNALIDSIHDEREALVPLNKQVDEMKENPNFFDAIAQGNLIENLIESLKKTNRLNKKINEIKPEYDELCDKLDAYLKETGDHKENHNKGLIRKWPKAYNDLQKLLKEEKELLEELKKTEQMSPENVTSPQELISVQKAISYLEENLEKAADAKHIEEKPLHQLEEETAERDYLIAGFQKEFQKYEDSYPKKSLKSSPRKTNREETNRIDFKEEVALSLETLLDKMTEEDLSLQKLQGEILSALSAPTELQNSPEYKKQLAKDLGYSMENTARYERVAQKVRPEHRDLVDKVNQLLVKTDEPKERYIQGLLAVFPEYLEKLKIVEERCSKTAEMLNELTERGPKSNYKPQDEVEEIKVCEAVEEVRKSLEQMIYSKPSKKDESINDFDKKVKTLMSSITPSQATHSPLLTRRSNSIITPRTVTADKKIEELMKSGIANSQPTSAKPMKIGVNQAQAIQALLLDLSKSLRISLENCQKLQNKLKEDKSITGVDRILLVDTAQQNFELNKNNLLAAFMQPQTQAFIGLVSELPQQAQKTQNSLENIYNIADEDLEPPTEDTKELIKMLERVEITAFFEEELKNKEHQRKNQEKELAQHNMEDWQEFKDRNLQDYGTGRRGYNSAGFSSGFKSQKDYALEDMIEEIKEELTKLEEQLNQVPNTDPKSIEVIEDRIAAVRQLLDQKPVPPVETCSQLKEICYKAGKAVPREVKDGKETGFWGPESIQGEETEATIEELTKDTNRLQDLILDHMLYEMQKASMNLKKEAAKNDINLSSIKENEPFSGLHQDLSESEIENLETKLAELKERIAECLEHAEEGIYVKSKDVEKFSELRNKEDPHNLYNKKIMQKVEELKGEVINGDQKNIAPLIVGDMMKAMIHETESPISQSLNPDLQAKTGGAIEELEETSYKYLKIKQGIKDLVVDELETIDKILEQHRAKKNLNRRQNSEIGLRIDLHSDNDRRVDIDDAVQDALDNLNQKYDSFDDQYKKFMKAKNRDSDDEGYAHSSPNIPGTQKVKIGVVDTLNELEKYEKPTVNTFFYYEDEEEINGIKVPVLRKIELPVYQEKEDLQENQKGQLNSESDLCESFYQEADLTKIPIQDQPALLKPVYLRKTRKLTPKEISQRKIQKKGVPSQRPNPKESCISECLLKTEEWSEGKVVYKKETKVVDLSKPIQWTHEKVDYYRVVEREEPEQGMIAVKEKGMLKKPVDGASPEQSPQYLISFLSTSPLSLKIIETHPCLPFPFPEPQSQHHSIIPDSRSASSKPSPFPFYRQFPQTLSGCLVVENHSLSPQTDCGGAEEVKLVLERVKQGGTKLKVELLSHLVGGMLEERPLFRAVKKLQGAGEDVGRLVEELRSMGKIFEDPMDCGDEAEDEEEKDDDAFKSFKYTRLPKDYLGKPTFQVFPGSMTLTEFEDAAGLDSKRSPIETIRLALANTNNISDIQPLYNELIREYVNANNDSSQQDEMIDQINLIVAEEINKRLEEQGGQGRALPRGARGGPKYDAYEKSDNTSPTKDLGDFDNYRIVGKNIFDDDLFAEGPPSMVNNSLKSNDIFKIKDSEWDKLHDIYEFPILLENFNPRTLFPPGQLKKSVSLAVCLASLCDYPDRIKKLFSSKYLTYAGVYGLKLKNAGRLDGLLLNDKIPLQQDLKPLLLAPQNHDLGIVQEEEIEERAPRYSKYTSPSKQKKLAKRKRKVEYEVDLWPHLVAKGLAKSLGCYERLLNQSLENTLSDLTGMPMKYYETDFLDFDLLRQSFKQGFIMIAKATSAWNSLAVKTKAAGCSCNDEEMKYWIISHPICLPGEQQFVEVKNHFCSNGSSHEWNTEQFLRVNQDWVKYRRYKKRETGEYWINMEKFSDYFSSVLICRYKDGYNNISHALVSKNNNPLAFEIEVMKKTWVNTTFVQPDEVTTPAGRDYATLRTFLLSLGPKKQPCQTSSQNVVPSILKSSLHDPAKSVSVEAMLEPGMYKILADVDAIDSSKEFMRNFQINILSAQSVRFKPLTNGDSLKLHKDTLSTLCIQRGKKEALNQDETLRRYSLQASKIGLSLITYVNRGLKYWTVADLISQKNLHWSSLGDKSRTGHPSASGWRSSKPLENNNLIIKLKDNSRKLVIFRTNEKHSSDIEINDTCLVEKK